MDDGRGSKVTVFKWNMDAETWMPTTDYAEVIGQACDSISELGFSLRFACSFA
jgi:hypothetical protein